MVLVLAKGTIDVSSHVDSVTHLFVAVLACVVAFFLLRPELWRRLVFDRVDPRPAALLRISFGLVVLWTFVDLIPLARILFTDEGMWMTPLARKNYGGPLKHLWDPQHGWEHWWSPFEAIRGGFSLLHMRSDPPFVWSLYAVMLAALVSMILGGFTRWTTIVSWILVEHFYRYSPIFYTGGDTVVRVFLFLGLFCRWGEAYSLDSWWRRKRAILAGASELPSLRPIPAWPQRLMMLQLAIIYCASGALKTGITWRDGTALYYALNLDHFYRVPATGVVTWLQYVGVLPLLTWIVHYWEMLFPLLLVGVGLVAFERDRAAGTWPQAGKLRRILSWLSLAAAWGAVAYVVGVAAFYYVPPEMLALRLTSEQIGQVVTWLTVAVPVVAISLGLWARSFFPRVYRFVLYWLLGKRTWLVFGFFMHLGIDLGMNVGTFVQVMIATYFAWLSGEEVEGLWRFLASRPVAPGTRGRPVRSKRLGRALLSVLDRLRFREPRPLCIVLHALDDSAIRRAALLRPWDLCQRLGFQPDATMTPGFALRLPGEEVLTGTRAASELTRVLPGLWLLRPFAAIPPLRPIVGRLVLRLLAQR